MSEFNSILNRVNNSISSRNGRLLSLELALPVGAGQNILNTSRELLDHLRRIHVLSYCQSNLVDQNLATVFGHRTLALVNIGDGNYEAAYQDMNTAYNTLLESFGEKDEDTVWLIPSVSRVSNDMRFIADKADMIAKNDNKNVRECLNSLTRGFTIVAKDRTPVTQSNSRKLAMFAVTNVLFKTYFRLNTLQLCGKLINIVEGPGGIMDNLRLFPVSEVVVYKYYIGRLKMFEDKYEEARECLRFALRYCPKRYLTNRKRILVNLLPVEMCLGVMPTEAVARIYGLNELYELGLSIRRGDLRTFESLVQQYQKSFIRLGLYLVLEQAKNIAYRSLFKRIAIITSSTKLNLVVVERVMQWLGEEDVDLDEIECILSNLIYRNQVKGYLSHQKRYLIVSKADPFPVSAIVKKAKAI